jgi:tetratricopeptide (TPR) repeat protein
MFYKNQLSKKLLLSIMIFNYFFWLYPAVGDPLNIQIKALEDKLSVSMGKQKVDLLNRIAELYRTEDNSQSREYCSKACKLADAIGDIDGKMASLALSGYLDWKYNHKEDGLKTIQDAHNYFLKTKNTNYLINTHNYLGDIYYIQNNHDLALPHLMAILQIGQNLPDNYLILEKVYQFLGYTYIKSENITQAISVFNFGLTNALRVNNRKDIAKYFLHLGNSYIMLKNHKQAEEYYHRAKEVYLSIKDEAGLTDVKFCLASLLHDLNKPEQAIPLLLEILEYYRKNKKILQITKVLFYLGKQYFQLNQLAQAHIMYQECLQLLEQTPRALLKESFYLEYASLLYARQDYRNAYDYLQKHLTLKEQTLNENKNKAIAELQEKYQSDLRQKEIELLKKGKRMQLLLFIAMGIILILAMALFFRKFVYLFAFWKKKNYISHYRLLETIGSGGMGTVYKACDVRNKKKLYAIKVIREEYFTNPTFIRRFKHESMIVDQLNHPNIVKIIERGETPQGIYLVMEFLQGRTLAAFIKENQSLLLTEALPIMMQISSALAAIHQKQIIHRDIKPENIFITKAADHACQIKILDFGLAKASHLTRLTQTGMIVGTLFYQSPEQTLGLEITQASDIYSLAILFYQLLSGRLPFSADSAIEIARQISEDPPPDIRQFNSAIPDKLHDLLNKMFEKEPPNRPTAEEIVFQLSPIHNSISPKSNQ